MTVDLSAQMEDSFDLDEHRWNNRVLLVFSPNNTYTDLTRTMEMVQNNRGGISERDLKVFQVLGNIGNSSGDNVLQSDDAQDLRERFKVSPNEYMSILIGKDGTEKMRTGEVVTAKRLFEIIDAMPMRKLEMKDNG
jgi:hypothetical protein